MEDKEEIEAVISVAPTDTEDLPASDTVCRHCGVDFHFNQVLRNHMKRPGGCQKPYACRLCSHSFSNKVNALRHMQKLHSITEPALMEAHITVNDAMLERIKNASPCASPSLSLTPPPEHSMRLPIQRPSLSPHAASAFSSYSREDRPLDFSVTQQDSNNNISDEPMDLSMKKTPKAVIETRHPESQSKLMHKSTLSEVSYLSYGVGYPLVMDRPIRPHPAFGNLDNQLMPPPLYPIFNCKYPYPVGTRVYSVCHAACSGSAVTLPHSCLCLTNHIDRLLTICLDIPNYNISVCTLATVLTVCVVCTVAVSPPGPLPWCQLQVWQL